MCYFAAELDRRYPSAVALGTMIYPNPQSELQNIENQIYTLAKRAEKLRADNPRTPVKNYPFKNQFGEVTLLDLFGDKDKLIVVHNMGQGCRYCTTWADGFNGFVPHLEDRMALVLVSKDDPNSQRRFANSRGWRFRMASHGGESDYIREQTVVAGQDNMPGIVAYERKGNEIFRKNSSVFGPGDQFCSLWPILSLAGFNEENWTPQFSYWKRPEKMDDGGKNLN